MEALDFALQPVQVAVIDQHVVGVAQAFIARGLGLQDRLHLFGRGLVALHGALHLQVLRRIDHQYPLGDVMLAGFYQQRRHQNGIRRLGAG